MQSFPLVHCHWHNLISWKIPHFPALSKGIKLSIFKFKVVNIISIYIYISYVYYGLCLVIIIHWKCFLWQAPVYNAHSFLGWGLSGEKHSSSLGFFRPHSYYYLPPLIWLASTHSLSLKNKNRCGASTSWDGDSILIFWWMTGKTVLQLQCGHVYGWVQSGDIDKMPRGYFYLLLHSTTPRWRGGLTKCPRLNWMLNCNISGFSNFSVARADECGQCSDSLLLRFQFSL